MRAAVQYAFGEPLVVEDVALDEPKDGEVLVRMAASGVCRSDWHTVQGIHPHVLPVVLGHEGSAIVEAVGTGVRDLAPGDHVVLSWLPYCGACPRCVSGRPNLCERMQAFDAGLLADGTTRMRVRGVDIHHNVPSSFAELAVVPANTAIAVDPDLPLEQVALLGCAVMTGVGAVLNTARVRPGQSVAVVGCGGVGISAVQAARIAGASEIVAVDVVDAKLDLARALGATRGVNARSTDPLEAVGPVDVVVECLGHVDTIELAVSLTEPGGTAVLVGMAPPEARPGIPALDLTLQERTVTGCWYGSCVPPRDFPMLVELVRSGRLNVDAMIGRTFALDDINDALALFDRGEDRRSVIAFA
jgi:S-(hydroxymethyl)glutathione dehydrogenase / alcohol dehydrogenase